MGEGGGFSVCDSHSVGVLGWGAGVVVVVVSGWSGAPVSGPTLSVQAG